MAMKHDMDDKSILTSKPPPKRQRQRPPRRLPASPLNPSEISELERHRAQYMQSTTQNKQHEEFISSSPPLVVDEVDVE